MPPWYGTMVKDKQKQLTYQSRNVISKNKIKTNTKNQSFRISGERKIKSYLIGLDGQINLIDLDRSQV